MVQLTRRLKFLERVCSLNIRPKSAYSILVLEDGPVTDYLELMARNGGFVRVSGITKQNGVQPSPRTRQVGLIEAEQFFPDKTECFAEILKLQIVSGRFLKFDGQF